MTSNSPVNNYSKSSRISGRPQRVQRAGARRVRGPNCAIFPLLSQISLFSSLSGGLLVELWSRFKTVDRRKCAFRDGTAESNRVGEIVEPTARLFPDCFGAWEGEFLSYLGTLRRALRTFGKVLKPCTRSMLNQTATCFAHGQ